MAVMVRCPLVYVNTMFSSNRLSPACSSIILPWTVSPSSSVLSISCTRVHQRRRHWFSWDSAHRSSNTHPLLQQLTSFRCSLRKKRFLHFCTRRSRSFASINLASQISMAHDKASPRKASTTFAVSAGSSSALHNDFLI